jgi:hypothetical protein
MIPDRHDGSSPDERSDAFETGQAQRVSPSLTSKEADLTDDDLAGSTGTGESTPTPEAQGSALPFGRRPPAWVVGAVGLAVGTGIVLRLLIPANMDPTIFLALGEAAPAQTSYAQRLLGDVATRENLGHDGKFFFIQANDPWHLHPEANAAFLDRPVYRAQRMLYPVIAGGIGLFPPGLVVWSMLVTNVLCLGIGALVAARIALISGASPWLGLTVPLNIGLLFELWIDGSGILAYLFALGAVYALATGRGWTAAALLSAAALSRETMVAFASGILALGWIEHRRLRWRLLVMPLAAMGIWQGYLQVRLMGISGQGGASSNFGPPFLGLVEAFRSWIQDPTYLVLNIAILVLVGVFAVRGLSSRSMIVWGALPFVGLATVLSVAVWGEPFNIARALAPVFTAAPFLLLAPRGGEARQLTGRTR